MSKATCVIHETHEHQVVMNIETPEGFLHATLTKDEALLLAIELVVASTGLSRAEVAERFKGE